MFKYEKFASSFNYYYYALIFDNFEVFTVGWTNKH